MERRTCLPECPEDLATQCQSLFSLSDTHSCATFSSPSTAARAMLPGGILLALERPLHVLDNMLYKCVLQTFPCPFCLFLPGFSRVLYSSPILHTLPLTIILLILLKVTFRTLRKPADLRNILTISLFSSSFFHKHRVLLIFRVCLSHPRF